MPRRRIRCPVRGHPQPRRKECDRVQTRRSPRHLSVDSAGHRHVNVYSPGDVYVCLPTVVFWTMRSTSTVFDFCRTASGSANFDRERPPFRSPPGGFSVTANLSDGPAPRILLDPWKPLYQLDGSLRVGRVYARGQSSRAIHPSVPALSSLLAGNPPPSENRRDHSGQICCLNLRTSLLVPDTNRTLARHPYP